jgi:glycosyltransferase involved in cell wall biosynthesis
MSEHEGFGVPLVEAMHFDLPVLAHSAAAVPETIGEGGILVNKADWPRTLASLKALLFDPTLRGDVISAAQKRRSELSLVTGTRLFRQWILDSLPQT